MRLQFLSHSLAATMFVSLVLAISGSLCAQENVSAPIPVGVNSIQAAINLLDARWDKNVANREYSVKELERYPESPEVVLAYTLNRMQHRRYKDALSSARKLQRLDPDELDGAVLHIWLETLSNNYEEALVAIKSLGPKLTGANNADKASLDWSLKRLGRLVGYMQGPAFDKVNADLVNDAIAVSTKGLTPEQLNIFNRNREEVLQKYETLLAQNRQFADNAQRKAEAENASQTQDLNAQNQRLEDRAQQLEPRIDQLRNEGIQKLEQIRTEARPLQQQLASLSNQIDSANFNLDSLYLNLALLNQNRRSANRRGGLVYVDPVFSSPSLISIEIQNRLYEIDRLRYRYRIVADQLAEIESEAYRIQNEYGAAVGDVNSQLNSLDREKRRNDRQLTKLAKGPKVAKGKLGSLRNRTGALKTYDPISLEVYRQTFLQKLN